MNHHLKKQFSDAEQMYIAIMINRGKPIMDIAKGLHVCYYRVKREIIKLKKRAELDERIIRNTKKTRKG